MVHNFSLLNFIEHQSHHYSESKPERIWYCHEASSFTNEYLGQKDTSYYQIASYKQRTQYFHDIIRKQVRAELFMIKKN